MYAAKRACNATCVALTCVDWICEISMQTDSISAMPTSTERTCAVSISVIPVRRSELQFGKHLRVLLPQGTTRRRGFGFSQPWHPHPLQYLNPPPYLSSRCVSRSSASSIWRVLVWSCQANMPSFYDPRRAHRSTEDILLFMLFLDECPRDLANPLESKRPLRLPCFFFIILHPESVVSQRLAE